MRFSNQGVSHETLKSCNNPRPDHSTSVGRTGSSLAVRCRRVTAQRQQQAAQTRRFTRFARPLPVMAASPDLLYNSGSVPRRGQDLLKFRAPRKWRDPKMV
jgi:hypothetical protein